MLLNNFSSQFFFYWYCASFSFLKKASMVLIYNHNGLSSFKYWKSINTLQYFISNWSFSHKGVTERKQKRVSIAFTVGEFWHTVLTEKRGRVHGLSGQVLGFCLDSRCGCLDQQYSALCTSPQDKVLAPQITEPIKTLHVRWAFTVSLTYLGLLQWLFLLQINSSEPLIELHSSCLLNYMVPWVLFPVKKGNFYTLYDLVGFCIAVFYL